MIGELTPGRRVVVRYRLAAVDGRGGGGHDRLTGGGPSVTDVLGTLVEAGAESLVVTADSDGSRVVVPTAAVVAAKHIPPRPPRRRPRRS